MAVFVNQPQAIQILNILFKNLAILPLAPIYNQVVLKQRQRERRGNNALVFHILNL